MTPAAVVLPTYNERDNIAEMLRTLLGLSDDLTIMVVDDDSPDGTADAAERSFPGDPRLVVIRNGRRLGFGPSLVVGFRESFRRGFGVVLQMDCDFSHPPAAIPALRAALDGADVAIGSRYVAGGSTPGWSRFRRLISRSGNIYARAILGIPCRDLTAGYKAWRAETLRRIEPESIGAGGYCFQIESVYRASRLGARIREVPIAFTDRRAGTSKMNWKIVAEAFGRVPKLRWSAWRPRVS